MILIFFFKAYGDLRDLHSSPTRRYPYLFDAVARPKNPRQLELIDNPGRPTVADANAPLQQRRRADLVLDADLGRLAKQRIPLARRLARPAALFPRFLRFGDVLHLLDDVHLDALLELGAARGIPAHEPFGLVGRDETALDAHALALAGEQEQHVAIV